MRLKYLSSIFGLCLISAVIITAQTPTPTPPGDKPLTVLTEEIKVNFSAVDEKGRFVAGLRKEDVVITENNSLHQASSIRHIPANILILLDTGGEDRQAKSLQTTRRLAKSLIDTLQPADSVALIEYNDDVKVLSDWTSNKTLLNEIVEKKLNFGKRSKFVEALNFAAKYFENSPSDNQHLVLITDGLDSLSNEEQRRAAFEKILITNINVHAISYTQLEQQIVEQRKKSISGGGKSAKPLPPGAGIPIQGQTQTSPIATVSTDRAMINKNKQHGQDLAQSERELTALTEDTNGEIYLLKETETLEIEGEITNKTATLAGNIDSQYVITYTPKRSLSETAENEERIISVTSRRPEVLIQGRRKIVVTKAKP